MSPESESDRKSPAEPGDLIGQYVLKREIGRGGMGVVFRARDIRLQRDVALKCPWSDLVENPRSRKRFLREARASSRLNHPGIVSVLDTLEHEGIPCLVFEIVEGRDLSDLIAEKGRIAPLRAVKIAEKLADALKYAHSEKVIHRDINPRNIMVTDGDHPLLSDFGLARALPKTELGSEDPTRSTTITTPGAVLGTPRYMPPEQVLGKEADARSDIYSLGIVMYEMCAGEPPFSGDNHRNLFDAILHSEPEPISRHTYDISEEQERIIRKSIAKRPDERYQSAEELLVDLRALRRQLAYKDYSSDHDTSGETPERKRADRRWGFAIAAVALVAAAGAIWWAPWNRDRLPVSRPIQITHSEFWEGEPALSPDGDRIAFVSNASGNFDIYVTDVRGGEPLQITDDPADDRNPVWHPDGTEIYFGSDRGGSLSIWKVGQFGGGATLVLRDGRDAAISPDGKEIAWSSLVEGGEITSQIGISPLEDLTEPRWLTGEGEGFTHSVQPTWSPDGKQICYSMGFDFSFGNDLWIVSHDGIEIRRLTEASTFDCWPEWSPGGRFIYFTSEREGTEAIWRINANGGVPERVTLGTGPEIQPDLSSDGMRLAYSTGAGGFKTICYELESGETTVLSGLRDAMFVAISPDGSRLGISRKFLGKVDLWETHLDSSNSVGALRRITDHEGVASHPVYSPDGRWIAYYRIVDGQRDIWIVSSDGGHPIQFTDHERMDFHPAWSRDGSRLAFVSDRDGGARVWAAPVEDGKRVGPPEPLSPAGTSAYSPVWSPDGSTIAFGGLSDDQLDLWTVPSGGGDARRITQGAGVTRIRWDALSGDLLVSATWGGDEMSIKRLSPTGGPPYSMEPEIVFGKATRSAGMFDMSNDGRLLIYRVDESRSDIWLLESQGGAF